MTVDIANLRKLLAEATSTEVDGGDAGLFYARQLRRAALRDASVTALPGLLDELEAAREALAKWQAWLDSMQGDTVDWLNGPSLKECAGLTRAALGGDA